MHVGVPQPKAWASDNAFGAQSYSPGITGTRNWLFVKVYTDEGVVGRPSLGLGYAHVHQEGFDIGDLHVTVSGA